MEKYDGCKLSVFSKLKFHCFQYSVILLPMSHLLKNKGFYAFEFLCQKNEFNGCLLRMEQSVAK